MTKFSIILFSTLVMSSAHASQKITIISSSANVNTARYSNQDTGFKFEVRPGAGTSANQFTYGINLEGKYGFRLGNGTLFTGLETGIFRSAESVAGYEGVTNAGYLVPVAASSSYEFPVSNQIKLYGGASVGVGFGWGTQSYDSKLYPNTESVSLGSSTAFVWRFRPGMVINDQFVAELPVGTADGNFFFMPNVGIRF